MLTRMRRFLNSKNSTTGLEQLPSDIHHIIVSDLIESSSPAVSALAQTSKALREMSLPYTYHTLTLSGANTKQDQVVIGALQDKTDDTMSKDIIKHIRKIIVKEGYWSGDLTIALDKITSHGRLRQLSWETAAHMPDAVLDKLSSMWPDLELTVRVTDRQSEKENARPMDYKLLSSPLLHTLIFTVYTKGYEAGTISHSDWPPLTRLLAKGNSIRVLKVQTREDGNAYHGTPVVDTTQTMEFMRLAVGPTVKLPPLEELSISAWSSKTYQWDDAHCMALKEHMDWSRLRKLDFGYANPEAFFRHFRGEMPQLEELRFGVIETPSWMNEMDPPLEPAQKFIASVKALKSLEIHNAHKGMTVLWDAILRHKQSLQALIIRPSYKGGCYMEPFDFKVLKTIPKQFASLKRFGCSIPYTKKITPKYVELFASMRLERLNLFIEIPGEASAYSKKLHQDVMGTIPAPPLDQEGSREAAIAIMETISRTQKQQLRCLTMDIDRIGYEDRCQPYIMSTRFQVRATNQGKGKYEFRGKIQWYNPSFEDELRMEED